MTQDKKQKPSKKHYAVVLKKEAIQHLEANAISVFIQQGTHFNCLSVEPDTIPGFIRMVLELPSELHPDLRAEISIPTNFVLYIIAAHKDKTKTIGFLELEKLKAEENKKLKK
jgi:hypothetical protein